MILRVLVFYVLAFFFLMALGGGSQAAGLPAELGLAQWGPAIGAGLMLLIFRKDGHRLTFIHRETPLMRYLLAAIIPAGAALVVFGLTGLFIDVENAEGFEIASPLLFAIWTPLGALGEEIGWRGYLQKRLNTRLNGIVSALIVGVMWMPIHVHLFQYGVIYMLMVTVMLMAYSVVIYALVQDTGFSILLAAIFHIIINYANMFFLDIFAETLFVSISAGVWLVIALVAVYTRREAILGQ